MRLAALVGVLLLLLGAACSETRSRTLQLAPPPAPTLPALYPPRAEVLLPSAEPQLSIVLEDARWEEDTLITLWRVTNVGTERLAELQWQIAVAAIDPLGEYVQEMSIASRFPLPVTATIYPGKDIVGERLFVFAAPVPNVVVQVSVSIGLLSGPVHIVLFKAPRPAPGSALG